VSRFVETAAPPGAATAPTAPAVAHPAATAEKPLSLQLAYDFIFTELARAGDPLLPQIEHAMRTRSLAAADGDGARAAAQLGVFVLTSPAALSVKKRVIPGKKKP
jgi:hypothetical protein